jgi:DNA excision repair protein ERCC-2
MAIKKLPQEIIDLFPYQQVRPIQDDLIETIYDALHERKNVIVEGANGLGKTVATLSAAIPIAREKGLQIVHVCRTNKQADRVISELKEISKKTNVSGVSIRGRLDMCPHKVIKEHADDAATASILCGQLKKLHKCEFYTRMTAQTADFRNVMKVLESSATSSAEIVKVCKDHRLCPYEVILKLVERVDVVGASYQYIFNPPIREIFLNKVQKSMPDILLIVDECHNLIDASLSISSDQLSIYSVRQTLKEVKAFGNHRFLRLVRALNRILDNQKGSREQEEEIDPKRLLYQLSDEVGKTINHDYVDKIISEGYKNQKAYLAQDKSPRSYLHRMGEFLQKLILTKSRPEFLHLISTYRTRGGNLSVRLEIVSLDARFTTQNVLKYVNNSIHISGTLEPIDAYLKTVGLNTLPNVAKALDSPYTAKNIQGYIIDNCSTRLRERTPENYQLMCEIIAEAANNTPANTGIFTASYNVMDGLMSAGLEKHLESPLFQENSKMSSTANDQLVNRFKKMAEKDGGILLGVLGGRSSEGADFPGDQMNTCIIVGIPYARPTTRIQAQIDYLEQEFERKGREYGYVIPAVRRAAQAAGRVIRSIEDRGLVLFLDSRFSYSYIKRLLPLWLRKNIDTIHYENDTIADLTKKFYSEN